MKEKTTPEKIEQCKKLFEEYKIENLDLVMRMLNKYNQIWGI